MARSETLRFRAGEVELAGTLLLPDAAGRHPWALLLPSWLPRDRDGAFDRSAHPTWFDDDDGPGLLGRLAVALASLGVASFRYDKRGCGESGGAWADAAFFTMIDDARDAIGAMRSRDELDLRRTAIVGHGEGAGIALSVAIGDPAISAVGLVGAAARSWRDVLRRGVAQRARDPHERRHALVAVIDWLAEELIEKVTRGERRATLPLPDGPLRLDLAGWEQAFNTPALALATMLHRSVLLTHGTQDRWSHPDESMLLAEVLRGSGNEPRLHTLAGAGHDLAELDDDGTAALAAELAALIATRELPPVLLAIEEMRPSR